MGNLVKETPYSEITASLEVLDRLGVKREHLGRLRAEPEHAKRVAEFMRSGGLENSIDLKLAREILGEENFWGIEEWSVLYGVQFTKKQLREIAEFPWNENVLNSPCPFVSGKTVKETHFAFLGLETYKGKPFNIAKWSELHAPSYFPRCQLFNLRSDGEIFITDKTCQFRWYLMLKEISPDSVNKDYITQRDSLPATYELPFAIEEVTKHLLYYLKNVNWLDLDKYSRCQDVSLKNNHVFVGVIAFAGIHTETSYTDEKSCEIIGIAPSRRPSI